jgi:hypothetical protein
MLTAAGGVGAAAAAATTTTTAAASPRAPAYTPSSSHIRLSDAQRDELLAFDFTTGIVFASAKRVGKAIRSAVISAALNDNFDPLVALKVVLAAGPSTRRGALMKTRLDLFFDGDVDGLLEHARKLAAKPRSGLRLRPRPADSSRPHAAAMAALAAGRPGRALRRLSNEQLVETSDQAAADLRNLHPIADAPLSDTVNTEEPLPPLPGIIVLAFCAA